MHCTFQKPFSQKNVLFYLKFNFDVILKWAKNLNIQLKCCLWIQIAIWSDIMGLFVSKNSEGDQFCASTFHSGISTLLVMTSLWSPRLLCFLICFSNVFRGSQNSLPSQNFNSMDRKDKKVKFLCFKCFFYIFTIFSLYLLSIFRIWDRTFGMIQLCFRIHIVALTIKFLSFHCVVKRKQFLTRVALKNSH